MRDRLLILQHATAHANMIAQVPRQAVRAIQVRATLGKHLLLINHIVKVELRQVVGAQWQRLNQLSDKKTPVGAREA